MNTTTQIQSQEKDRVAELVRAAQGGNREAFGELFERFQAQVLIVGMRRLRDQNEAQELVQEVFIQAMLKLEQLRDPACFGSWVRSIANRMAINRVARRAPDLPTEPVTLEATCIEDATPLASILQGGRRDQLHEGLQRLRELDRETLEAFYVHGQSLLEMSDEFDAPLGTIKRRLHVARKRLAKEVESLVAV